MDGTIVRVVNTWQTPICVQQWAPFPVGGDCFDLASGQSSNLLNPSSSSKYVNSFANVTVWASVGSCSQVQPCNHGPSSGFTQFEFTLNGFSNYDYYDVSAVAGFNMGVSVYPTNSSCPSESCVTLGSCNGATKDNSTKAVKTCPSGTSNYIVSFSNPCQKVCNIV